MDARACTPKRVKDILSSFLHDVITEDVSQQSSSLEALAQTGDGGTAHKGSQPTTRGCRATDRAAFFSRVQTYSPLTWFAKPAWLSALACAQYGWVNVDVDLLRCVGCNKHLSGRMPSSFEPQVYAECCKKLVDSLKMAHSKFCCWVSYPSPDSFLRLPLSSRTTAETEFVSLLKALLRLQAELPRIETVQIESMGLTRDTLLSLRRYAGVTWQSCDDGSYDLDDTFCSACMLAVCGWASSSSSSVAQLRCRYCNRSAGLWNYHTYTSPSQPDDVINESHDSSNSLPPGGTTCDSPPKSSSALVTPMGDADERHSTGSDSHVEDVSGKGSSSPGCEVEVRLEVGEESVGLMGESRQQDAESSDGTGSESTSKNTSDTETKSRVNDENGMQNGLVEEHLVRNESVVSTESKSLPESSGEANREENIGQTEINEEECCVLNESDKEKCCVPSESDKEECCVPSESDKEECCVPSESNNEEHVEQTENDKEEHVEETETSKLDMLSEVDAVDGCSVQEVKCFERSAEENGVAPSHQPNLDNCTEPGDVKSDNLKTEDDLGSTREVQFAGEDESPNVRDDTDVTGGTLTETATGETHKSGGCGEPDELMDVDISETSEDMSRKRTMSDGGERNCSTGQQSLDNGHNDVTSHRQEDVESTAKRRKLRKPSRVTFDPIAEHHSWCPWVLPDTHPDRGSEATPTVGDRETLPGWRRFLEVLTPVGSHESHSLISIVKTSPPCVGLRSIRKLFLGWTRSATPDC